MQIMHLRARYGHIDSSEAVERCEDALRKAGSMSPGSLWTGTL